MITGLRNEIYRLIDENYILSIDTNKIAECTRQLALLPAHTAKDIYQKLYVCIMLADCESVTDYLQAWEENNFDFVIANTDQTLMLIGEDKGLVDDEWYNLYESVAADIKQFINLTVN